MKQMKCKAFIKRLKQVIPIKAFDFPSQTVEVDLSDGEGDATEYSFDEVELILFIGFKDINNQELYEGDIVLVTHLLVEHIPTYKAVVEWGRYRFVLRILGFKQPTIQWGSNGTHGPIPYHEFDPYGLSLKRIGNQYENPHLLLE